MNDHRYPVYIIAHNPNTLTEVDKVMAAGANALEPDVQYNEYTKALCISHFAPGMCDEPPGVEDYLLHVKQRLQQYPALSLVLFDIKLDQPEYNSIPIGDWGKQLYEIVNSILGEHNLVTIYSVSKKEQAGIFEEFAPMLRSKEALMIDEESDVEEAMQTLQSCAANQSTNIAYADGIAKFIPELNIPEHIQAALTRRVLKNQPDFIGTWVLAQQDDVLRYLRIGVDGMIVSHDSICHAIETVNSAEFSDRLRLAERADNPFDNGMLNYGLEITTAGEALAGTDALIHCALRFREATVNFNIDGDFRNVFRRGSVTNVTVKVPDHGPLLSISLSHNGAGIAPQWLPTLVRIFEWTTHLDTSVNFGEWLRKGEVHTRDLDGV